MADRKRAELAEAVRDACEGLDECGFAGLLETPVLKIFTELHKFNDTEQLSTLIGSLDRTATRLVSAKSAPGFPELMVLATLIGDIDGPAAPPEGADSPLDTDFQSLSAHLQLAMSVAVLQFARPGTDEAKQGPEMSAGMLLMLHEKVAANRVLSLAVEHSMLGLLSRHKRALMMLHEKTWSLAALNTLIQKRTAESAAINSSDGEEQDGAEDEDIEDVEVEVEDDDGEEAAEEDAADEEDQAEEPGQGDGNA